MFWSCGGIQNEMVVEWTRKRLIELIYEHHKVEAFAEFICSKLTDDNMSKNLTYLLYDIQKRNENQAYTQAINFLKEKALEVSEENLTKVLKISGNGYHAEISP